MDDKKEGGKIMIGYYDKKENTQLDINVSEIRNSIHKQEIRDDILHVYDALCEKGYNPVAQIIGYLLSDDPTYITAHKNARSIMSRIDRFEILEEMIEYYFAHIKKET